jgi:hypothetical protein
MSGHSPTNEGAMMSFDFHRARTLRVVISGLLGTTAFVASVPALYARRRHSKP